MEYIRSETWHVFRFKNKQNNEYCFIKYHKDNNSRKYFTYSDPHNDWLDFDPFDEILEDIPGLSEFMKDPDKYLRELKLERITK